MTQYYTRDDLARGVSGYLKRELKKRKMTQEKFAEKVGVSDRTVRRWVSGGIYSLDVICVIALCFHVSVGDIFREAEDVPAVYQKALAFLCRVLYNPYHLAARFVQLEELHPSIF